MITVDQAAASLAASPRPILFVDTCTLLDIVRAPLRDLATEVRAAVDLGALATAGTVRLFIQDIVTQEWTDNLPAAQRDGESGIRAFAATWQIAADLGQPTPPLPVLPPGALVDGLERLSQELLAVADLLDRDPAGMSWAIDRVAAKRKPSSAKATVKGAYILGHALRLSALLGTGYPHPRLFISSNRSDFAAANSNVFHTDIAPEATAAGLGYAASLEAALAELRATGEIP